MSSKPYGRGIFSTVSVKVFLASFCVAALSMATLRAADDWLDQVSDALTISCFDDNVRARLSGTVDFEAYHMDLPAPGLLDTKRHSIFTSRLTTFLDVQAGSAVYAFAQARIDQGLDPATGGYEGRLDEYALRVTPWEDGRVSLQIGKFSTVVGNWVDRHLSWDNPFINAPLPYENVTAVSDLEPPEDYVAVSHVTGSDKYEHVPLIWGPAYSTGISVAGRLGQFDYAAEVKNAALAERTEAWEPSVSSFEHPTVSGRVGVRPSLPWNLGFSASAGPYLLPEAAAALPAGRDIDHYHQLLLGQDVSFEWHHWQIWVEVFESSFEVPRVGKIESLAYYLEAKYKITPQLFGAIRWNQQFFAQPNVPQDVAFEPYPATVSRMDFALGYRVSANVQLKLQYSLSHNDSGRSGFGNLFAAQFTLRF